VSRFYLIGAQETTVANSPCRRLRAGTTVCDTAGNAQPGDVICAALCASPNIRMIPLDAAAVSAFAAVGITAVINQQLSSPPTGGDSIDV
jgi:hypothetical protein